MLTQTPSATRTEALTRLRQFLPQAGRDYAARRNYDLPDQGHPHVSGLSPYLRHRLITEAEVVEAVLGRHSATAAEKFIQEVFWRTYWKGWLEQRPGIWASYREDLGGILARMQSEPTLQAAVAQAEAGQTEIDAFNDWAKELVATGYLHNHARMWFASIWIFTLRLPWQVGADFFLRHLLDGDPASNTLSWRWVAGLQTQGKHYLARASNISKYTEGRHNPEWRLDTQAAPLKGPAPPTPRALPPGETPQPGLRTGVLLTEEDLSPAFVLEKLDTAPVAHAALLSATGRSPRPVADHVLQFTRQATADALGRWSGRMGVPGPVTEAISEVLEWAKREGLEQIVTPYSPVGPAASALRRLEKGLTECGIALTRVQRDWDSAAWPHATKGFFKFKAAIPELIRQM